MATHDRSIEHVRPLDGDAALIDRRHALGSLAAAGAMLALPRGAHGAEHPDAALFDLVRRARALDAKEGAASQACDDAESRMDRPPMPAALIVQESDCRLFSQLKSKAGASFCPADVIALRSSRAMFASILPLVTFPHNADLESMKARLARIAEIDQAHESYAARRLAAREAVGLPALEAEANRLLDELRHTWRAIAFTPARTSEGVLAKVETIAVTMADALDPADYPEMVKADDVLAMAAADYAALLKPTGEA